MSGTLAGHQFTGTVFGHEDRARFRCSTPLDLQPGLTSKGQSTFCSRSAVLSRSDRATIAHSCGGMVKRLGSVD